MSLDALVAVAAGRWPDRIALADDRGFLTWAALDAQVGARAAALRRAGVTAGDRVALYTPRDRDAVVWCHALLRLGAAVAPLDPAAPTARARVLVDDLDPALVVADAKRAADLAAAGCASPVAQAGSDAAAPLPTARRSTLGPSPGLAYVLFTSGSTGTPKGVALGRAAVEAFVDWSADAFALGPEDRVAAHAPLHFDLSHFELLATARAGARVELAASELDAFPAATLRRWSTAGVTAVYVTPTRLAQLAARGAPERWDLSALRRVLFAGEVMPPSVLRRWMTLLPAARFANLFGPTETNVCTWYAVDAPPTNDASVPIGRAVPHLRLSVRDACFAEADEGELWASGTGVMDGYWRRPDLDAERFRTLPDGTRAFGTGDLVRRVGPLLHFAGRRDEQRKRRGVRVEPGEIDAALRRHPDVADVAVVARDLPDGGVELLAFVVPIDGAVDAGALWSHVERELPRDLHPDGIDLWAEIPRTSTGKTDRATALALHAERHRP